MVKRYDLDPAGNCDGESGFCAAKMHPVDDGDYVRYEDFETAVALLRESVDVTMNWDGIADRIDAFLRAAVQETVNE